MRSVRHLRWYIVFLFFFATIISYVDRQALSVSAPVVRQDLGLSAARYSYLVSAFLAAYTIGQTITGRLVDRLGVRLAMALFIAWWSVAGMLHAAATGFLSLLLLRALLGLGEAGTLPSTLRAIAEWFPQRERALATSIFTAGTAIGALLAVPIVAFVTLAVGWRASFLVTGLFGFVWLAVWLPLYRAPEQHPRLTEEERSLIFTDRADGADRTERPPGERVPIRVILARRKPWGIILGRMLVDPVWSFYLCLAADLSRRRTWVHPPRDRPVRLDSVPGERRRQLAWRMAVGAAAAPRRQPDAHAAIGAARCRARITVGSGDAVGR